MSRRPLPGGAEERATSDLVLEQQRVSARVELDGPPEAQGGVAQLDAHPAIATLDDAHLARPPEIALDGAQEAVDAAGGARERRRVQLEMSVARELGSAQRAHDPVDLLAVDVLGRHRPRS